VDNQTGKHVTLGLITITITACLGVTNVFAELPEPAKIGLGILSLIASFIIAVQTFFKFEEKANAHRLAAIEYGKVRRNIEAIIAAGEIKQDMIDETRKKLDELASSTPNIPEKFHKEAKEQGEN
jgi:hypothetical protein